MRGFLYVLINPSMSNLVKIGMTTREVEQRCRELNSATGVATPFIIGFEEEVSDAPRAERLVHNLLQDQGVRLNPNREFFEVSLSVAVKAINEVLLKTPELLDLSQCDQDFKEKPFEETNLEPSRLDLIFHQIQEDLADVSHADTNASISYLTEDGSQNFEKVCLKAKRKLELLIEEEYYPAIPLLFDLKLGLEDYEGIPELFDKAAKLEKNADVTKINRQPIAYMIGKTLLLPKRSVVPIDVYEWLDQHKLATTAWLVDDLEKKIVEISYHAKENRGRHFLDLSLEEFKCYLTSNASGQVPYDLKSYAQYAYEYIDVVIGFRIIDDIFKNHRFSISDHHSIKVHATELEIFYSKVEERFQKVAPLAKMIGSISEVTNLYIGLITGHENQEKVLDAMNAYVDSYQRQWELYGVQGYFES